MVRSFVALAVLLAFSAGGRAYAQPAGAAARTSVLATDDRRIRARAEGDVKALSRIYAEDYSLITAEGEVRSKAVQLGELAAGQLRFAPLRPRERDVRLYGQTALVISRDPAGIVRHGRQIGGDLRMTRLYVWRQGRWQLVSAQATRVAASPPAARAANVR
jgi:hypothetical protein